MSSYDLLTHEPDVATEDLPDELSGVLCRCTGYRNIIDAVDEVAHAHRDGLPGPGNCAQRTLVGRTPAGAGAAAAVGGRRGSPPPGDHPDEIALPTRRAHHHRRRHQPARVGAGRGGRGSSTTSGCSPAACPARS